MKSLTVAKPSHAGGNRIHGTQGWAVKTVNRSYDGSQNCIAGNLYARYRLEKSFFGYDPSVLKSGVQKYARRDEVDKGLWCLLELDLFSLLEWNGAALNAYLHKYPEESRANTQQSAQRIRTNMVNRLVVMMSEEVNISAWWMPIKMLELYKNGSKTGTIASSRKFW